MKTLLESINHTLKYVFEESQVSSAKLCSELFYRSRATVTTIHFDHLISKSFARHMAMATFYEELPDLVDSFCEAFIGLYGELEQIQPVTPNVQKDIDCILEFRTWLQQNRQDITDDSSQQNILDEMETLCNSTIYKLQNLK